MFKIHNYKPIQTSGLNLKEKVLIELWKVIQATFFRLSPRRFNRFRRLLLIMFGAKLHQTVSISQTAKIHCPWNLEMDELASLGEYSWSYSLDKIKIGKKTCISAYVVILTGAHDINNPTFPLVLMPVTIGDGVWVAVGAKMLPGITISDFAVVGTGSVVTKDVEPWTVVGGNPAKFIKKREMV